jgi:hypothetical protein
LEAASTRVRQIRFSRFHPIAFALLKGSPFCRGVHDIETGCAQGPEGAIQPTAISGVQARGRNASTCAGVLGLLVPSPFGNPIMRAASRCQSDTHPSIHLFHCRIYVGRLSSTWDLHRLPTQPVSDYRARVRRNIGGLFANDAIERSSDGAGCTPGTEHRECHERRARQGGGP